MESFLNNPYQVLHLLNYLQSTLLHPAHVGWIERLGGVVVRFYVEDQRCSVRLRALKVLSEVTLANLVLHEDRLLESCVLPHLTGVEEEADRKVRVEAVELIARLAKKATGPRLGDLLDLLDKICCLLGAHSASANSSVNSDTVVLFTRDDFDYQRAAVHGVISCLKVQHHLFESLKGLTR